MLTRGDDYPIHQTPEPVAYAGSARNFYDRYFFNGYSPDLSLFFAAALGVYPHLDVIDAAFCPLADGRHRNVRASRRLDALGARAEGEQVWRAYRLYAFSGVRRSLLPMSSAPRAATKCSRS